MPANVRIAVVLIDVRSTYNVGAIMRTLDGVGGGELVCCGITPHPELENDPRSPVVRSSNTRAIAKTALGAERNVQVSYEADADVALARLARQNRRLIALEQHAAATPLFEFHPGADQPLALVLGGEIGGIPAPSLDACDAVVELPQLGVKESLNVSVAAGIALYWLAVGAPRRPVGVI